MAQQIPGTVLATYSGGDGDFYLRKMQALSQALSGAAQRAEQRRKEQEKRELEEIERFYVVAAKDPELGLAMGAQLKQKYGDRYPTLGPIVDVLNSRGEELQKRHHAAQTFYDTLARIEGEYEGERAEVDSMPDAVETPLQFPSLAPGAPPMQVVVPTPNVAKVERQAQLSQVQPALFEYLALQAMDPRDRARARAAGVTTVSPFDPMDDLPPEQRAVFAATAGWLTGDSGRTARIAAGLETSPAAREAREAAITDREDRQTHQTSERKARHTEATELESTRTRNRRGEDTHRDQLIRGRHRDGVTGERGGGKGDGKLWSFAVEQSEARVKQWEQGEKAALEALPPNATAQEKAAARKDYRDSNPRPARLTTDGAVQIAEAVRAQVRAKAVEPAQQEALVAIAVEAFVDLTVGRRGGKPMSSDEALRAVLSSISGGGG